MAATREAPTTTIVSFEPLSLTEESAESLRMRLDELSDGGDFDECTASNNISQYVADHLPPNLTSKNLHGTAERIDEQLQSDIGNAVVQWYEAKHGVGE